MIKTSLIALLTIAVVSSAVPAFAMPAPVIEKTPSSSVYFSEPDVEARLQERGISATSIESWGSLIRVFVRNDDGTIGQLFFTRDSLTPVNI